MRLYTIGFTQKTAEQFFSLLIDAGVRRVLDTRLNNRSQLAGFSKSDDLPYFLKVIGDIGYRHAPEMAPTQDMLDRYKKLKGSWWEYETEFLTLIRGRGLSERVDVTELADACLLCSEHPPDHCHRRLVAEYLQQQLGGLEVVHLM
jgi:uncharacterized protein (DUF488 family)